MIIMFNYLVNKNGTSDWIMTKAICIEDAIDNIFNDKSIYWDTKDGIIFCRSLTYENQLYCVKEVI